MIKNISNIKKSIDDHPWPDEKQYLKRCESFTALVPVYINDCLPDFKIAIKSVVLNTVTPNEILILQDGPVREDMSQFIEFLLAQFPNVVKTYARKENRGLGFTAAHGVEIANNELIARIDADDISDVKRFEKQLRVFKKNNKLDIIGSNVAEFDELYNIYSYRTVPSNTNDIYKFSKMRSPFNHPSVMFKKEAVIKSGNYQEIDFMEDYDLWMRMISSGIIAENINEDLVYMRASNSMYSRRGGMKYIRAYVSFRYSLLKKGLISINEFGLSTTGIIFTSLVPVSLRKFIYGLILRRK
ncbi:glycosyltransferase [Leuconostoc mesenteroides]|uniref:glycosyltransferase n=2 Tax=Leuconostoc mesenteroides TaxID=1245 RepID=UPI00248D0215|nr:glycosyltransferase [Leuconostoc mesenteroides]